MKRREGIVKSAIEWLQSNNSSDSSHWLGMPAFGRLRWLIPAINNPIEPVSSLAPPTGTLPRIGFNALTYFTKRFGALPGLVRNVALSQGLIRECQSVLGLSHIDAISIGTIGPRQRLTLLGRSSDGHPCIAKIGLGEHGGTACESEARALAALANDQWWSPRIPRLLRKGHWKNRAYVVQSVLQGRPLNSRDTDSLIRMSLDAPSTCVKTLRIWIEHDALNISGLESLLCLRKIQPLLDEPVNFGWVHGDWAPWNARLTPQGEMLIFDWEQAAPNLPRCIDPGTAVICAHQLLGRKITSFSPTSLLAGALWVRQHWHQQDWSRCCNWVSKALA